MGARAKAKAYEKTPERFKNASSFQVRLRTGAVYITLTSAGVLINDITTVIMLSATAAICAGEFYYILRNDAKLPNEAIGIAAAICYPIAMWWAGLKGVAAVTFILLLVLLVWYTYWMRSRITDVCITLFGAMYTGLMLSGIIVIRQALPEPWGGLLVFLLLLSIWGNDAFAYLVGSKIGKHKLAPRTSPKKSWEGFIAGLIFSMGMWVAMSFVPGVTMPIWMALLFGLVCGGMEVLGDLVESRIKRNVGVKDSGTIMPGHGGLLDRCDSLFLASVTAAILLTMGGCLPISTL
jgi:phosphatidate cytidylyltransferase